MDEPKRELHLFFARNNLDAVILYRARKTLYRLIGWQTQRDEFTFGQWIKSRVYEGACALSPDGKHFMFSSTQKGTSDYYMAISKPPYFTAIEFATGLDSYSCGGFFLDDQTVSFLHTADDGRVNVLKSGFRLDRSKAHWPSLRSWSERKEMPNDEWERLLLKHRERCRFSTENPAVYRCEGARLFRITDQGAQLLKDFSDMKFETIKAPYQGVPRGDHI